MIALAFSQARHMLRHLPIWRRLGPGIGKIRVKYAPVAVDSVEASRVAVERSLREEKLRREIDYYRHVENVHDLPEIFHYWSNKHLKPMLNDLGVEDMHSFFCDPIVDYCRRNPERIVVVVSLGAGNCDFEVKLAEIIRERNVGNFLFRCIEINPSMVSRARACVENSGLKRKFEIIEENIENWEPGIDVDICMANQSIHHFVELETLFDTVRRAIGEKGIFIVSDMIGRNGHMRWPEALDRVHEYWRELPEEYRWNHQLSRREELFENWDCSTEGNEGIRAQDILGLLMERFCFHVFIAWGNIIDKFIDRSFGHNFEPKKMEDCNFIDRVAYEDEKLIDANILTPTHILAVMGTVGVANPKMVRARTPEHCLRDPNVAVHRALHR